MYIEDVTAKRNATLAKYYKQNKSITDDKSKPISLFEPTQIEVKFDPNVKFNLGNDSLADYFEEVAAIYEFESGKSTKDAERLAVAELAQKVKPSRHEAIERYWSNIFAKCDVLDEYQLINRLLKDDDLTANLNNNSLMLNKIFKALLEGYIVELNRDGEPCRHYRVIREDIECLKYI